jgi:RNA polymerase sigma-70 factor, ECF subfamily
MERAPQLATGLPSELTEFVKELHGQCSAAKFGIGTEDLSRILGEVVSKYAPGSSATQARDFCKTLKLEELVLARACAAGNDKAWDTFMVRYREKLYETGLQIAREDSAARDLADSLYADLFGTKNRDGVRVSKLSSYTGRGSLEGWLRTVMAQEHVNRYRKQKRLVSLEEETEDGAQFSTQEPVAETVADPRLVAATDGALAALSSDDRFVLSAYYLDGRTLAEIARMLGVHESTISRKVDKLAKSLRKQILAGLTKQGMSRRQAEEALEVDVRDVSVNLRARLVQDSGSPTFPSRKERAPAGDGSSTS